MPVLAGVVEPVSYNKLIRDGETKPVRPIIILPSVWFVQENTCANRCRFLRQDFLAYPFHGMTGVEDVIHEKHMLALHI